MRPLRPALAAAVLTLVVAAGASAQTYAPPGSAGRGDPSARSDRRADWEARRQAHESREVADLSTVLRLRPEQQAGLRAWLEAGRGAPGERRRDRMRPDPAAALPTTAQTLDREAARMTEREGRMRAHMEATRRFYASLGPDQQAAFDALERLRHGGGGRHGGWRGHGMGEGGMKMGWRGRDPAAAETPPARAGD